MRIVGLDIHPNRENFSLFLIDGDQESAYTVHISSLIKTLESLEPDIIAIDDESEFRNLLDRIAEATGATIVRAGRRGLSIAEASRRAGIWTGGHPSPSQTASLAARLARLGIFDVVLTGVRETVIKIAPERASYKGGREMKYKRALKVFIEHAKEDVEKALRNEGIEYDTYVRGNSYEIRAYERIGEVRKTLKDLKVEDVRLELKASRPIKTGVKGKYIVGVDPGTHVGLAFLDIYGALVHSATLEGGRESVVSYIRSVGDPLIIAVDVPEIPSFVKRIATALKAPIYVPDYPISIEEKREIASEYNLKGSSHERDALSAAVKAYYKYRPKIERSIRAAREYGLPPEEVVFLVMRNYSVSDAIEKLMPKPKIEEKKPKRRSKSIEELEKEISSLRRKLDSLTRAYRRALEEIEEYKIQLDLIRSEHHRKVFEDIVVSSYKEKLDSLEKAVEDLRRKLDERESMIKRISQAAPKTLEEIAIGKYVENLTRRAIEGIKPLSIEQGDVVFVGDLKKDSKGLKEISKASYIVAPRNIADRLSKMLNKRVIPESRVSWKRLGGLVIYDRRSFDRALKRLEEEEQKVVEKVFKNIIFDISGAG